MPRLLEENSESFVLVLDNINNDDDNDRDGDFGDDKLVMVIKYAVTELCSNV